MVALVDELASPDRHVLVGGTIVREAIYLLESNSAGSSLARKQEHVDTTQLLENFIHGKGLID
jgi:hypothetical protein